MTATQIACGVLAAATYGSFIWGFFAVFVRKGTPAPSLNRLSLFALIAAVTQTTSIALSDAVAGVAIAPGVALYFVSLGLFFWTAKTVRDQPLSLAFSPDLPQFIHHRGPYRWVRHPFYTSYLTAYFAGWVLSQNHWNAVVVATMIWVYIDAAKTEERKFAASTLAADYAAYQRRTGMFLPRVFPLAN